MHPHPTKVWTVAEAKARLSEILRRANDEGPQHIGTKKTFVVVPAHVWQSLIQPKNPRQPMGQWLINNIACGGEIKTPNRKEAERDIPFLDENAS